MEYIQVHQFLNTGMQAGSAFAASTTLQSGCWLFGLWATLRAQHTVSNHMHLNNLNLAL